MTTPRSFAKSLGTVLTAVFVVGSSTVFAAEPTAAAAPTPPAPAAPPQAPVAPDPASVTEVGVQRLPGSAYPEPENRGLPHGSLYLTFHGLQWPYMPAAANG